MPIRDSISGGGSSSGSGGGRGGVKGIATPIRNPLPSFPEWEDPPLPGRNPATPGGQRTVKSGAGLRTAALVGASHRVPLLYGRCLITPDIVAASMSGYRAEFKTVISEGPIDAVETWLTDPSQLEEVVLTLGTMTTPVYQLTGTIGLAAAYIRTRAGRPYQPRCVARGRKPFDPRLGAWGAGIYPDPAKCAYSKNGALIFADATLFPQYGWAWPNITPDLVDWQSVEDAADWCDAVVDGEKRCELNLYLQAGKDASLWTDTLTLHTGLRWREEGGLWRLDISGPVATVAEAITDDHVVDGTQPRFVSGGGAGLADRPNVFTAEWTNPADWTIQTVTIRHPQVEAGLEAARPAQTYKLHGFQTAKGAYRALWRIAHEIWSEQEIECVLTAERIDLTENSRVPVNLSSLGLSGDEFLVTKATYETDTVTISARRYDPVTWTPDSTTSPSSSGTSFFDVPDEVVNAALEVVESETTYTSPLEKVYTGYAGISWEAPSFPWVRQLRVKIANTVLGRPATTLTVLYGGSGHTVGQAVSFVTSTGTGATAHVSSVDGGGAVTAAVVDTQGTGYVTGDWARTGPGPTDAQFTISGFGLPDLSDPGWDEERAVPVLGDAGRFVDPVASSSLRPFRKTTETTIYAAGGGETEVYGTFHPVTVLVRVESLAGRLSQGVCLVAESRVFSSSSTPATDSVKRSTSSTPADGDVALWDAVLGGVRFMRRTGFVEGFVGAAAPSGSLLCNGSTIGSASSGATARANADTEALFTLLWTDWTNAVLPIQNSSGGATTRGASAAVDFAANKRLPLPDLRQRFPLGKAASGTGSTLGGTGGAIDHTHTGSGSTGGPSSTTTVQSGGGAEPGSNVHGHDFSFTTDGANPPFIALNFIVWL